MSIAYSLKGTLLAQLQLTLQKTDNAGLKTIQRVTGNHAQTSWTLDDTADEADDMVVIQSTLGAGANETHDLHDASNSLENAFGTPIEWDELQGLLFMPDSSNGGTMTIGGATNECFDAAEPVPAGGVLLWAANGDAGKTIVDGSADEIKVTNNDGAAAADYVLILLGVKA
jgi:hypothetical protein